MNLESTSLIKHLRGHPKGKGGELADFAISLCREAAERMKLMQTYAPQYTLHDEIHLFRVVELMGLILSDQVASLNIIEAYLLVLAAYFHDQGMVPSSDEIASLEEDPNFRFFRNNWIIDHPNYKETENRLSVATLEVSERLAISERLADLNSALLVDYLRVTHGSRSAAYLMSHYLNDPRLNVDGICLTPFLASLCESHTVGCDDFLGKPEFNFDEQISGSEVNMPFLACVLRMADILDFDRDRTPEVLLRNIHFTSPVSLKEWQKHRSVRGWSISSERIRFTIYCEHPSYEVAARKYMDWIDEELEATASLCEKQPFGPSKKILNLPRKVDRSRILPLNNAYRAHDLEFGISRDEVVRLLMMDKLYGGKHLCIRELLQNSLDALRYRTALFAEAGLNWPNGLVSMTHALNADGHEVIECVDNGVGMDEEIIKNFFVKIGRSYYRSPQFERERSRLKISGNDFDPCSKFGIGFMSCFMIGDRITIHTRRDYGIGKELGRPLVVEIHGLSGLVVIRDGESDQDVGTKISIISQGGVTYRDFWTDDIQLCTVLKGYAMATEFPIRARCAIVGIEENLDLPPTFDKAETNLEKNGVVNAILIEQDLSEVDPELRGYIRESFLSDESNLPCLKNSEGEWVAISEPSSKRWVLSFPKKELKKDVFGKAGGVPICVDGILIAGSPGRYKHRKRARSRLGYRASNIFCDSPALVDARGSLKPEITPARVPPDLTGMNFPPGWRRLDSAIKKGEGLLWGKVIAFQKYGMHPEVFWKLSCIYQTSIAYVSYPTLWEHLSIPTVDSEGAVNWRPIKDVKFLTILQKDKGFLFKDEFMSSVVFPSSFLEWEARGVVNPYAQFLLNKVVMLMCRIDLEGDDLIFRPVFPDSLDETPEEYALNQSWDSNPWVVKYGEYLKEAISVRINAGTLNRLHPLVQYFHSSRYDCHFSEFGSFVKSFLRCVSDLVQRFPEGFVNRPPSYWQKRIGYAYLDVPWDTIDSVLRPPYKVWSPQGWINIDENEFLRWRQAATPSDE